MLNEAVFGRRFPRSSSSAKFSSLRKGEKVEKVVLGMRQPCIKEVFEVRECQTQETRKQGDEV